MKALPTLILASTFFTLQTASAHEKAITPDSHAPIGVMGDHMHKQGEWMVSFRRMQMSMEGNLQGSDSISAEDIVTQIANPNAPPPTMRVVPLEMQTTMHMLGVMYAPSDKLTLMAMFNHVNKNMDHATFMGMMGSNLLGEFTAESSGIGDTKIGGLWRLFNKNAHKVHLNMGLSLPTGSIDNEAEVLSPMNTRPTLRMPYAMQLGSGTYDLEPGITYTGHRDTLGWGAQALATLRLGENSENYTLGNKYALTTWGSYRVAAWSSLSLRLTYTNEDAISGADARIAAPVPTANPDNYGGERLDLGIGINLVGQQGTLRGHRLALEYQSTEHQHVNGVQMAMQSMLTLGYQYAF